MVYDINGNLISSGGTSISTDEFALYGNNPTPTGNNNEAINVYKFPIISTFGNEYLNGWYKKLFYGQKVTIAVDGDSTTEESYVLMSPARRSQIVGKIMRIGGHKNFTVHKNGYGSGATGDYVGKYFSSELLQQNVGSEPTRANHPNGLLSDTMAQNPDLIIFGYGLNDYNRYRKGQSGALWDSSEELDLQGRINLYKSCIEEFLKRLRGAVGTTVDGRECYGKSEYDTAVILCVPISRATDSKWAFYCRDMIKKLCRQYHCGFFDPTAINYDHSWSDTWSRSLTSGGNGDGTHPAPWTNADFMSGLASLIFPIGLWFEGTEIQHSVTYTAPNCNFSYKPDTFRKGAKFETYVTATEGYVISSVTVKVSGVELGRYDYSFTDSNGYLQVGNVGGDMEIIVTTE